MALPALEVRVPNIANALLSAEQIRNTRAERQGREQQVRGRNALLNLTQTFGGLPQGPAQQQKFVNALALADPNAAVTFQNQFAQRSAEDQKQGRELAQTLGAVFAGVNDQASYDRALQQLPQLGIDPAGRLPPIFDAGVVGQINNTAQRLNPTAGFSLSPGQTRFNAQSQPVASVPATPPRPTQRQADVAALVERGFSPQQAEDIAAGRIRVATDPVTGETQLVNVATAATQPLGAPSSAPTNAPVLTATERGRLFNQNASIERVLGLSEGMAESAAAATGPRGNLGALVNSIAGFAGSNAPIPADQIAAARQDIRLFNQIAKSAIVNNPRFPVAEQRIVQEMLPDPNTFFTNPSVEFNNVVQLQEFLRNLQTQNSQSLGVDAPQPTASGESLPTLQSQAEFDALPSGARYINPDDGQIYRKP